MCIIHYPRGYHRKSNLDSKRDPEYKGKKRFDVVFGPVVWLDASIHGNLLCLLAYPARGSPPPLSSFHHPLFLPKLGVLSVNIHQHYGNTYSSTHLIHKQFATHSLDNRHGITNARHPHAAHLQAIKDSSNHDLASLVSSSPSQQQRLYCRNVWLLHAVGRLAAISYMNSG